MTITAQNTPPDGHSPNSPVPSEVAGIFVLKLFLGGAALLLHLCALVAQG